MQMQNVSSLGVEDETREYNGDKTYTETGLLNGDVQLTNWLANSYNFTKGAINVIIDNNLSTSCTYNITGNHTASVNNGLNTAITGTVDVEAARATWAALTSKVSATGNHPSDSYITIAAGSWLQIGDWVLKFEETYTDESGVLKDLTLDGFNADHMSDLIDDIKAAVELVSAEDAKCNGMDVVRNGGSVSNANTVKAVLKEGTKLAVSSSWAVLQKDTTINITGLSLGDTFMSYYVDEELVDYTLANALEVMRIAASEGGESIVVTAIRAFDGLVKAVDGANVTVAIDFAA
jgi:hypothetical protein